MTQKFWVLRRPRVKAAVDDDAVQKLDMEPWGLKEKEMHYIQGDGVFWGAIKLIGLQLRMVCSESKSVLMRWIYVSPNQFKIIVVFLKKSKQEHTARNTSPSAAIGLSLDSFRSCILYKNGVGVLQKLSTIGVKMRFGHKHWIHMYLSIELSRTHNSLCVEKSTWTHRVSNEPITTFTGFTMKRLTNVKAGHLLRYSWISLCQCNSPWSRSTLCFIPRVGSFNIHVHKAHILAVTHPKPWES